MRSPNYPAGTRPFIPLFWRLSVSNAAVLAAAPIILLVAPANGRLLVLVAGLAALLVIDPLLMRRALAPLSELATLMAQVDPPRPSARLETPGPASEVTNGMRPPAVSARDAALQWTEVRLRLSGHGTPR